MKTQEKIHLKDKLQEPFELSEISWLAQSKGRAGNGKIWAIVMPYIKADAIEDRLDDAVGVENWKPEKYEPGANGGLQCGISIRIDDEWITKWDGADNPQFEGVKGGMTNGFKRAARRWGIGRYLKKVKAGFALCVEGRRDGAYVDYIKEGNKKTYFSFTPPILPHFCQPTPERPAPPKTKEEWQANATKFKQECDELINVAEETITEDRMGTKTPAETEAPETTKLKTRIAEMIQTMKERKTRTEKNRAAYLGLSKEFLQANGDVQKLREIEAKASGLLARQAGQRQAA